MTNREDFTGQVFNKRVIINNNCTEMDWIKIGKPVPNDIRKYRLSKCLNCGSIIPVLIKNLVERPPKRCCFCSNIRNTSTTIQSKTNTWATYDSYAVINVTYKEYSSSAISDGTSNGFHFFNMSLTNLSTLSMIKIL